MHLPHLPSGARWSRLRMLLPPLALLAGGAGCGELNAHTDLPSTLATVHGALAVPQDDPNFQVPQNVHIALVWQAANDITDYRIAQDLPVSPVFPSNYVLDLHEPPPADAIEQGPAGSGITGAIGFLVAYEDLNGNGALDWSADAGTFVDRIAAVNPYLILYYLQGDLSAFGQSSPGAQGAIGIPVEGYNLVAPDCIPVDGGTTGPDGGVCKMNTFLPMSHPYDLQFSDNPALSTLICSKGSGGTSGSGGGGTSGSSGGDTSGSSGGDTSGASGLGTSGTNGSITSGTNGGGTWSVSAQGTPPGGYPAADAMAPLGTAGSFNCAGDGLSYGILYCTTTTTGVQDLCQTLDTECSYEDVLLDGVSPPPPGWPCP
jgi:hypothetical protein